MATKRTKTARTVKAEPSGAVADAVEEAVELTVEAIAEEETAKETVEPEKPEKTPSEPVEARTGPETTDDAADAVTALLRRPRPRECPATLIRFKDGPAMVTAFVDAPPNIVSEAWAVWRASGGDQRGLVAQISKAGAPVRYVRYVKELNLD